MMYSWHLNAGQNGYVAPGDVGSGDIVDAGASLQVFGVTTDDQIYGAEMVQAGGATLAAHVVGGIQQIFAGGFAAATDVSGNGNGYGFQQVFAGGVTQLSHVRAQGAEIVYSGGKALDTTVDSGGLEFILGEADRAVLNAGGVSYINYGGVANATTIKGGTQTVNAGGVANGTTVLYSNQYGFELVNAGGVSNNAVVGNGGVEDAYLGGVVNGANVQTGGVENIFGVGNNSFLSGGVEYVGTGGVSNHTTVSSGFESILAGGVANGSVVGIGDGAYGYELVNSGGVSNNATIGAGGIDDVFGGGSSVGATVNSGGTEYVYGTATGTTLNRGGGETVYSGGVSNATTINQGGVETIYSGGVSSGTKIEQGGTEYVLSGGAANNTTVAGGWLDVKAGGAVGGAVTFVHGDGGVLTLESGSQFSGGLVGFEAGDAVDLRGIAPGPGVTLGYFANPAGGTLTVSDGTHAANIQLLGNYTASSFTTIGDGNGGVYLFMPITGPGPAVGVVSGVAATHA